MAIAIWAEARGRREVFATRIVICGEKLSELKHGEREREMNGRWWWHLSRWSGDGVVGFFPVNYYLE